MTTSNSDDPIPSTPDFGRIFINNPDFDQIGAYLKRFNPIKTMGMEHMEIRHSAILGWLLDPQESHGMGDQFLKAFLAAALSEDTGEHSTLRALEISQADMMDTEVRREWRSIDLLVISRTNGWVFIIENKFHSKQHSDQLERYYKTVEDAFGGGHKTQEQHLDIHGVFLILHDEEPTDRRYAPIQYRDVLVLLKRSINDQVRPLAPEVKVFMQHYIEVIEEATDMDEVKNDMVTLARQLYRDHKKVLDFVLEHGAGNDFSFACEALFGVDRSAFDEVEIGGDSYIYNTTSTRSVRFLPKSWYDAFGGKKYVWHGCETWWAKLPIICWISLSQRDEKNGPQLRLYASVGPLVEHNFRNALIKSIEDAASSNGFKNISFQKSATIEGKKFSKFINKYNHKIADVNDSEEIAAGIEIMLKKFQPTIDALAKPMCQFIEYGKEKEQ